MKTVLFRSKKTIYFILFIKQLLSYVVAVHIAINFSDQVNKQARAARSKQQDRIRYIVFSLFISPCYF